MDWGKIAGDFANFQEKASAKLNEAADKAKEKIEEAKYRMQPPMTIGRYEVSIIKKVADGGFSEVFLAKSADNSEERFALKRIVCQNAPAKADAKAELKILKAFSSHPNIITVLGGIARSMTVPGQTYESMEVHFLFPFYEEGTVFDVMWAALENKRSSSNTSGGFGGSGSRGFGSDNVWPFPEAELSRVLGGVCNALVAMHKKGYAHRDIKPHNILLGPRGGILMDLGSAEEARRDVATKREAMKIEDEAAVKCSAPYRAPELTEVRYPCSLDETVDVWSLGCTAYAMAFNAYSPFESDIEGVKRLAILNGKYSYPHGKRNECGSVYSDNFCELIDRMLNLDNTKRPTMMELRNCFDCLAKGNDLPPLVGSSRPNHDDNGGFNEDVEADDAAALKIYLKHKEAEANQGAPHQDAHRSTHVASTTHKAAAPQPPAPQPVPEPNLLDFDSFQAPIAAISSNNQTTNQNSTTGGDDEFGDFEGATSFGDFTGAPSSDFGDFVGTSTNQQAQPSPFDSFQANNTPQQQQSFQQFHPQQQNVQQQQGFQQQQYQQQQFQQQQFQQFQPMQSNSPPPMNFPSSSSPQAYVDHFAEADGIPPPPPSSSSPYMSPHVHNNHGQQAMGKPKGLDTLNPFENM